MKCNVCESGEMEYQIILSKDNEETVVVPEVDSNLFKMVNHFMAHSDNDGYKGYRVSHMWNCTNCPNSQLEFILNQDAIAYAKAMTGKKRSDI